MLDSYLLLGKLHYAMGMYEDSLNYYNQAELQTLTEKQLPSRSLRIVAESYAIKGECLLAGLDLCKRILLKHSITMVFTFPLLS